MPCKPLVVVEGLPSPNGAWMVCKRCLVQVHGSIDDMTAADAMIGR